uniref:Uncharacterized protein n=1 Tax=Magallana gigas TaxID=29159 RepID=A0A8W8NCQ6_MAGGI
MLQIRYGHRDVVSVNKLLNRCRESSIVQIMAVCEDQKFNKYVTPSQEISDEANRVTEMKFDASTNELLHDNFWT